MRAMLLAGVVAFGWASAAVAVPVTYDAVADFSTASNPNGVWSYGYGTPSAGGLTFTAFTTSNSNFGSPAWDLPNLPLVGQAYTGGTVAVPANDLWLHPGNANNLAAIVRFTAAFSGLYYLNALFERADNVNGGGNGVVASLYENNTLVVGTQLATTYRNSFQVTGPLGLSAGDTLSFVVDRNGEYSYDSTGLQVTITSNDALTAVPEPASLALLGMGLAGIAAVRRRRAA